METPNPLDNLETLENEFTDIAGYIDDVVFLNRKNNKWYFWDETYFPLGPYENEHEARVGLVLYCWMCLDNREFGQIPKWSNHWKIQKELDKL